MPQKPTVTISCENSRGEKSKKKMESFFYKDHLAVTESIGSEMGYVVTHIPTGLMIRPVVSSKRKAIIFCKELLPFAKWGEIESQSQAMRMVDLRKKIVNLRKKLGLTT